MKNFKLTLVLLLALILLSVSACAPSSESLAKDGDNVVLFISENYELSEGETLATFMGRLVGSKKISSFIFKDGMLTALNGKAAKGNVYWMLYTDDSEYSNNAWGSVTLDGVTYYSATLGAEELPVKMGCTYVWMAQAF